MLRIMFKFMFKNFWSPFFLQCLAKMGRLCLSRFLAASQPASLPARQPGQRTLTLFACGATWRESILGSTTTSTTPAHPLPTTPLAALSDCGCFLKRGGGEEDMDVGSPTNWNEFSYWSSNCNWNWLHKGAPQGLESGKLEGALPIEKGVVRKGGWCGRGGGSGSLCTGLYCGQSFLCALCFVDYCWLRPRVDLMQKSDCSRCTERRVYEFGNLIRENIWDFFNNIF